MEYRDFILRIDSRPGSGEVLVVASPAGHGEEAPFVPPLGEEDLERVAQAVERAARRPPRRRLRHLAALGAGRPPDPLIEEVGDRLFRALFVGEVKDRFLESLERSVARGRGLRIRLRFALGGPDESPGAALQRLPWELLFRRGTGEFLALGRRTPVVRDLEGVVPPAPPPRAGPLVVLAVVAEPRGCPVLDLDRELRSLERAFEGRPGGVEVRPLRRATLGELTDALRPGTVDVLHFMGHGDLEEETGDGLLYLEDDLGGPEPVSGELLSRQLRDFLPGVRLVFLNACRTAETARAAPWAGMATALVRVGVGAVVAMQHRVADSTAEVFSREVYERLAAGAPVDEAVADGRLAIRRDRSGSPEWATPALFLRAADGQLPNGAEGTQGGEASPRPRGGWRPLAGGVAFLAAVAVVATVWFQGLSPGPPRPDGAPTERGTERGSGQGAEGASAERADAPGQPEEPEVSAGSSRRPVGSPEPEAGELTAPASPIRQLEAGEPVYLGEVQATVTVEFLTIEEHGFVRVTVSPDDGPVQELPVNGPETVVFDRGADRVLVHVLTIDWERHVVRLRASR